MKYIKLFENWQEDEDMESGSTLEYTHPLTANEAKALIVRALNIKINGDGRVKPILLIGSPGMGKDAIIKAAAEEAGVESLMLDLSTMDDADFRGIPSVTNTGDNEGMTSNAIPSWFPTEGPGILVLSDMNRAENQTLYSALQLAQSGRIGNIKLPEGWLIVATSDKKGKQLSVSLADRFTAYELVPTVQSTGDNQGVMVNGLS